MIWTRRAFLQTVLAGTAGAAVASVLPPALVEAVTKVPLDLTARYQLFEIIAVPVVKSRSNQPIRFAIGRECGPAIIAAAIHPRSSYRWVAMPGAEIIGPDLVNQSDADLDVQFTVKQCGRIYWVDRHGQVREVDLLSDRSELDWEMYLED